MKTSIINIANSFKNVYLENIAENDVTTKIYTHVYGDSAPIIEYHIRLTAKNVYKTIDGIVAFSRLADDPYWEYDDDEEHLTLNTCYYNDRYDDIEEVFLDIYFE
jgi:hypothetical protein